MKLVNLTPHAIKVDNGSTSFTVEPSGTIARIEQAEESAGYSIEGIEVIRSTRTGVIGFEDADMDHVYIVSSMVLDNLPDDFPYHVVAPDTGKTAKRNDKGHIVSVSRFRARG